MIRNQLLKISNALYAINKSNDHLRLECLEAKVKDINKRTKKKIFLEGDINYYALDAEQQIIINIEELKLNINEIKIIIAALITIKHLQAEISSLEKGKPISKSNINIIKGCKSIINGIQKAKIILDIKKINMVSQTMELIEQIENKENISSLSQAKDKLRRTIQAQRSSDQSIIKLKDTISHLQKKLKKTENLQEKLPKGMLDIKRALYFVYLQKSTREKIEKEQAKKPPEQSQQKLHKYIQQQQEVKFCMDDKQDVEQLLIEQLEAINKLMSSIRIEYQKLENTGGQKTIYLHKTTAFYWESLHVYRLALLNLKNHIDEISKNGALSQTGKLVEECINQAVKDLPSTEKINSGLNASKIVDNFPSEFNKQYKHDKEKDQRLSYFKMQALELVKGETGPTGKYFYLPYSNIQYSLDHPSGTDFADAAGNCHGETLMFLQQIGTKQNINNICPEADLIEFQLDQTKTIEGTSPTTLGEKIEKIEKVEWGDVEALLKHPIIDEYGDLCQISLGGLELESGAIVGHSIGLLRIKEPSPYKYVLYDYTLGAIGLESDDELKKYFDNALNYYRPFKTIKLTKHSAMNQDCKNFISSIKPLEDGPLPDKVVRDRWPGKQIIMLAKYGNLNSPGSVKNVLIELEKFTPIERKEIYLALKANENIDLEKLLSNFKFSKNEVCNEILTEFKDRFINIEKLSNFIINNSEHIDNLQQILESDQLLKLIKTDKNIFRFVGELAKDHEFIIQAILINSRCIELLEPLVVIELIKKNDSKFIQKAIVDFPDNIAIIHAALEQDILLINDLSEGPVTPELVIANFDESKHQQIILKAIYEKPSLLKELKPELVKEFMFQSLNIGESSGRNQRRDITRVSSIIPITPELVIQSFPENLELIKMVLNQNITLLSKIKPNIAFKLISNNGPVTLDVLVKTFPENQEILEEAARQNPITPKPEEVKPEALVTPKPQEVKPEEPVSPKPSKVIDIKSQLTSQTFGSDFFLSGRKVKEIEIQELIKSINNFYLNNEPEQAKLQIEILFKTACKTRGFRLFNPPYSTKTSSAKNLIKLICENKDLQDAFNISNSSNLDEIKKNIKDQMESTWKGEKYNSIEETRLTKK